MNFKPYVAGQTPTTASISVLGLATAAASTQVSGATTSFAMSPESLLYYCSSRLDSVDQQIDKYFKEQQTKNASSKQLGDLQSILSRSSFQWAGDSTDFAANKDNCWQNHASDANDILAIYRTAVSPEVKKAAAEAFTLRTGNDPEKFGDKGVVTATDIKAAGEYKLIPAQDATQWAGRIDTVKSAGAAVSKGAELNMIQLQSLVSQRQLAIQLTTQLMQNVHEGLKNVAGNFRG